MKTGLVYDGTFIEHYNPFMIHPERPERLEAVRDHLKRAELWGRLDHRPVRVAKRDELERVHAAAYLDILAKIEGDEGHLDPDTFFSPRSHKAAMLAAGSTIQLALDVYEGSGGLKRGLSLVRPPGHHAESGRGMGFCLVNNIAVAVAALLEIGVRRIAVVDFDVHHGNGTSNSFFGRKEVLFCSVHRGYFFPGTGYPSEIGSDAGTGYTINAPLRVGGGDAEFLAVFYRVFLPVLRQYEPEILLVSAGFDGHSDDLLGGMEVSDAGYVEMCRLLTGLSNELCDSKLVVVLEGGYDLAALGRGVAAMTRELLADVAAGPELDARPDPSTVQVIDELTTRLAPHWSF